MRSFRAYFDNAMCYDEILLKDDYAHFEAPNRTEAVRQAAQYKRAWGVPGKAATVVEVPVITVFGRYDRGIAVRMRRGGETMCREFGMDASVADVYAFVQECLAAQSEDIDGVPDYDYEE